MQVSFYAMLREIVGQKTVEFDLPDGVTVGELISRMVERYPDLRRELLDENGQLYGHVQVFINGRDATLLDHQLGTVLRPEDVVNVFPAVGGGLG